MDIVFEHYYSVIFTSTLTDGDNGYSEISIIMENLAKVQKGYLGMESAKDEIGITVSYWKDLDAIKNWKLQVDHMYAQRKGRSDWYSWYKVRVCKVEREYEFKIEDLSSL